MSGSVVFPLQIVRARHRIKPGWSDRFHDAMKKRKAEGK
jgi:bifunctional UDP-N-acetylglucosamine pyrophosphorylase/glucosamine-1-phosphate N-acetyltransferase